MAHRRGRSRGFTHSSETRAKIKATMLRNRTQSVVSRVEATIQRKESRILDSGFRCDSASVMRAKNAMQMVVCSGGDVAVVPTNQRCSLQAEQARAIISHVEAQGAGLASFVSSERTQFLQHVNLFDDASMWISTPHRPPAKDTAISDDDERATGQGKLPMAKNTNAVENKIVCEDAWCLPQY